MVSPYVQYDFSGQLHKRSTVCPNNNSFSLGFLAVSAESELTLGPLVTMN